LNELFSSAKLQCYFSRNPTDLKIQGTIFTCYPSAMTPITQNEM